MLNVIMVRIGYPDGEGRRPGKIVMRPGAYVSEFRIGKPPVPAPSVVHGRVLLSVGSSVSQGGNGEAVPDTLVRVSVRRWIRSRIRAYSP